MQHSFTYSKTIASTTQQRSSKRWIWSEGWIHTQRDITRVFPVLLVFLLGLTREVCLTVVMLPHLSLHVVLQPPRRPKAEYIPCSVRRKQVAIRTKPVILKEILFTQRLICFQEKDIWAHFKSPLNYIYGGETTLLPRLWLTVCSRTPEQQLWEEAGQHQGRAVFWTRLGNKTQGGCGSHKGSGGDIDQRIEGGDKQRWRPFTWRMNCFSV